MAKGFAFARRQKTERASRSGGASVFAGKLLFKLPEDGDIANVRFVSDDEGNFVYGALHHSVPVEGRAWGDDVVCIAQDEDGNKTDDDCPGCENDLKMKDRYFVHVLWKDAPVYKKDKDGKMVKDNLGDPVVIDHEDQCAVWPTGPKNAENLDEIDESYGLGACEFKVKRKGEKLDTEYKIIPADVENIKDPPTKAEKKIIAQSEIDLNDFIKPPSYEEFEKRLKGNFSSGGDDSGSGKSRPASDAKKKNPFKRQKDE